MKRIALLRGINVSGRNKIPMVELVELCSSLKWESIETYIQTGNIVFSAEGSLLQLELDLEIAIESRFGFSIPVTIREADQLEMLLQNSPLSTQATKTPSQVLLYFTKNRIKSEALEYLEKRAIAGEEVFVEDNSLWIYFPEGVGASKLTPSVIDRAVGSAATGRNWNTAIKIQSLCLH